MAEVRIAKSAFFTEVDGNPVSIRKGMIVDARHPILKGRENLFALPEDCIELTVVEKSDKKTTKKKDTAGE